MTICDYLKIRERKISLYRFDITRVFADIEPDKECNF